MLTLVTQYRELISTVIPAFGGIAFLILLHPRLKARYAPYFPYLIGISWLLTRVAFFCLIRKYLADAVNLGDIANPYDTVTRGGWVYQASRVLEGQMPYRDFFSNYSVLYSYLITLPYLIYRSTAAFVPLFMLFDLGCVFLIYAVAKDRWGVEIARDAVLAFTLLPITWYVTIRHSQDEVMLAFFAILAVYAWTKKRDVLAMVLFGIGFCCTKFMFGLIILPFLLASRHKIRDAATVTGTILAINLPFILSYADPLEPITNQDGLFCGIGFWPQITYFARISMDDKMWFRIATISMLIPLLAVIVYAARRQVKPADAACAFMMVSIALSPKTVIYYCLAFMPLFMIWAVAERESLNLVLFSVLGLVLPKFAIDHRDVRLITHGLFPMVSFYTSAMLIYWAYRILRPYRKKQGDVSIETGSRTAAAETVGS